MAGRILGGMEWSLVDAYMLFIPELVLTPWMVNQIHEKETNRGEWQIGIAYDADGRVLDRYNAAPGDRDGMALGPLTQQVTYAFDASDPPRCSRWRACVERGVSGMRRAATCLDYPLTPEVAQRVTWAERIAEEVDAERLTREAGRDALTACYLKPEGPCPIADGKEAPAATTAGAP